MTTADSHERDDESTESAPRLEYRPNDRLWPYAELSEHHSPEELAELDPELRAALFGARPLPFSITVVFPPFEGDHYATAVELARASDGYREIKHREKHQHRARFSSAAATQIRELYELVYDVDGCEVLVDDRPVPYVRELWLPLMWLLIHRGEPEPDVADRGRSE